MEYGAVYTSVYKGSKGYKGSFVLFIFIYVYGIYENKLQPTNNVVSNSVLADMFCVMCRHPPPPFHNRREGQIKASRDIPGRGTIYQ